MSLEYTEVGGVISNVKIKIGLTDFEISEISRFVTDGVVSGDDLLVCQNYLGLTPAQKDTLKTGIYRFGNGQTYDMNIYGDFKYQYYHPKDNAWYVDKDYSLDTSPEVVGGIIVALPNLGATQPLIQRNVTAPGSFEKQIDFAGLGIMERLLNDFDGLCKYSKNSLKAYLNTSNLTTGVNIGYNEEVAKRLRVVTARTYDKFN